MSAQKADDVPKMEGETMADNAADPDRKRGLYGKYHVEREYDQTGKHDNCRYFVLDPQHDPIAYKALSDYATYADEAGYGALALDLIRWLNEVDAAKSRP